MMLSAEEWSVLLLSVKVALWCVAITVVPGVFLGWLLAKRSFPGRIVIDALVHLPLVIPPVVVGYLLLLTLRPSGWLGRLGLDLAFTWKAAAIASAVMALPLTVRAVRIAVELVDDRLEAAAATLGAGPWRVFWTVTLPLAMPGVLTGCILAFARSLGEFGATITVAGNIAGQTRTLPLAIFTAIQTPGGEVRAIRLTIISLIVAFAALLISEWLVRRAARLRGTR